MPAAIALWDMWTRIAGPPAAVEPPSAGFVIDWNALALMTQRGIRFATLTHAAGISSTGDPRLDAMLPFDEPYDIPPRTARLVGRVSAAGGRIVAIGTTVVRALEHAAASDGSVRAGEGLANQRIGPETRLRVVDALLSGTHEPGTRCSHRICRSSTRKRRDSRCPQLQQNEELSRFTPKASSSSPKTARQSLPARRLRSSGDGGLAPGFPRSFIKKFVPEWDWLNR